MHLLLIQNLFFVQYFVAYGCASHACHLTATDLVVGPGKTLMKALKLNKHPIPGLDIVMKHAAVVGSFFRTGKAKIELAKEAKLRSALAQQGEFKIDAERLPDVEGLPDEDEELKQPELNQSVSTPSAKAKRSKKTRIRIPANTRWGSRRNTCSDLLFFKDCIEVCL